MKLATILAALIGAHINEVQPPVENSFDSMLIEKFTEIWRKFPPLRAAPRGFKRMNMAGLHAMISQSEPTLQDEVAEQRIRTALRDSGIAFLQTDHFLVRCRHDVCETLFVDRRPLQQRVSSDENVRTGRLTVAVGETCRSTDGYPSSIVSGLSDSSSGFSFFCINNPDVGN